MKTLSVALCLATLACGRAAVPLPTPMAGTSNHVPIQRVSDPRERHMTNLRQLTDGIQNAEAYFSFDGKRLIFQSTRPPYECDQIFTMDLQGRDARLLSTGLGRCTCSYFFPDGKNYLYSSTHLSAPACPPPPDMSHGYVWAVYPTYDIFVASLDDHTPHRLTDNGAANFAPFFHPSGTKIIFCSYMDDPARRNFDLCLVHLDGTGLERVTYYEQFDGFPMWAPDGKTFVFCSNRFNSGPHQINVFLADWVD